MQDIIYPGHLHRLAGASAEAGSARQTREV
jgi:hypothetical protein